MRREVWQQLGGLDERFGIGCLEDDDLCMRVSDAGLQLIVAQNVFIHHYGNMTFKGLGLDVLAQLESNLQVLRSKWGEERCGGYKLVELPSTGRFGTPLASQPSRQGAGNALVCA